MPWNCRLLTVIVSSAMLSFAAKAGTPEENFMAALGGMEARTGRTAEAGSGGEEKRARYIQRAREELAAEKEEANRAQRP